jgi:hypothetical protein
MIATIITLIKNLWTIGSGLPRLISLIAPIIRIIGSDEFQKMLESVYDAVVKALNQLRKESPEVPEIPQTETQRVRIVDRLKRRISLAWLDISESEYNSYCQIKNKTIDSETINVS